MKSTFVVLAVSAATAALAFAPGEIPLNVAVRSVGDGEVRFFRERDEAEHLKRKAIIDEPVKNAEQRRQADDTDPLMTDYEPVAMSGGELRPFVSGGAGGQ